MSERVFFDSQGILVTSTRVEIDGEIFPLARITTSEDGLFGRGNSKPALPFAVLPFLLLAADLMARISSCADATSFVAGLWFPGASLVIVPVLFLLACPSTTYCALRLERAGGQSRVIRGEDADLFDAVYEAINAAMTARG